MVVSSQFQGLLKEMEFVIGVQLLDKASVLIIMIMFSRSISSRSEKSSGVMAVLNSHLQRSVTCKYQNIGSLLLAEDKHSKPKSSWFRLRNWKES